MPRGRTELREHRRILAALLRSDTEVRGDDDKGKAPSPGNPAPLSSAANFTWTDTYVNLNHVIVFRNAHLCREYEVEFGRLRRVIFGRGRHGRGPPNLQPRRDIGEGAVRAGPHARASLRRKDFGPSADKLQAPRPHLSPSELPGAAAEVPCGTGHVWRRRCRRSP